MNVSIFGMGHVGFTTSVFLAQRYRVISVEKDETRLNNIAEGILPFYEPDLRDAYFEVSDNVHLTKDPCAAINKTSLSFITVGTPSNQDGSQNLNSLKTVIMEIGECLKRKSVNHTVVIKSTILPGTTEKQIIPLLEKYSGKKHLSNFDVLVNPDFTREGRALADLANPYKIVIGCKKPSQTNPLDKLYKTFYLESIPVIKCSYSNAEFIKYTQNAFLATKLSFINTISNICETISGTDINIISEAIGLDPRISASYLEAGLGYGGSCLPKDLSTLEWLRKNSNQKSKLFEAVSDVNDQQPIRVVEKAEAILGSLDGKKITVLGLAFKPNTDDIRDAPALKVIQNLLNRGAKVHVYDPQAMHNVKKNLGDKIEYCTSIENCIKSSDCCILATEWLEFRHLTMKHFRKMNHPLIIDARNSLVSVPKGIEYHRIGQGPHNNDEKEIILHESFGYR